MFTCPSALILVQFVTDDTNQGQGWSFTFNGIDPEFCNSSSLTGTSGSFSDGSGSNYYAAGSDCKWLIAPNSGQNIALRFSEFDTEKNWDYVYVHDGSSTSAPIIATFDGNTIPPVVYSSSNRMLVRFQSDDIFERQGFIANYTTVSSIPQYCGSASTITSNFGSFSDGSNQAKYANNTNCSCL